MSNLEIVISVDNRVHEDFKELFDAFMLASSMIKWVVTGGVGDDGNMVTMYTSSGGTPEDFFTLGSLLSELHGTVFLDVFNKE